MKAVVAAFNQEKALVGAFSVITNIRMELFQALAGAESPKTGVQTVWRLVIIISVCIQMSHTDTLH